MKTAEDLQDLVDQAYEAYKSVAQNVAEVNAAIANVMAIATAAAKNGEYSCTVSLGNLSTSNISNITLFKRYMAELMNNSDFAVSFTGAVQQDLVIVSWEPDDV